MYLTCNQRLKLDRSWSSSRMSPCMALTLDVGVHVLALLDEPDMLLAGLTVQIPLLALLCIQLPDALLQPALLRLVQHQRWAEVRWH